MKRLFVVSPLRYAGGKSRLVKHIVKYLPHNIKRLVSPFLGGASLEITIAKTFQIPVFGYDIFDILINYWYHQICFPIDLYNELSKLSADRETYIHIKSILERHWRGEAKIEKLQLAAYYYYNHNLSYGPGFLGWPSKVYLNNNTYQKMLERVKNFDVKNITVYTASFEESIIWHKNDFLYCDPPYYLGADSTVFKGIYPQRNFPIHHQNFNHEKLRDLLHSHNGSWLLSYNDAPTIREWYKDFTIVELPVHYTMGQGETRIGRNRQNKNATNVKKTQELLIIKY